jgi:hypothetical protein
LLARFDVLLAREVARFDVLLARFDTERSVMHDGELQLVWLTQAEAARGPLLDAARFGL